MSGGTRHRALLAVGLLLVLAGLVPLLRANAVARQQAWVARCAAGGGAVETLPPPQRNPMVVQTGRPVLQCRSAQGRVLSVRD